MPNNIKTLEEWNALPAGTKIIHQWVNDTVYMKNENGDWVIHNSPYSTSIGRKANMLGGDGVRGQTIEFMTKSLARYTIVE